LGLRINTNIAATTAMRGMANVNTRIAGSHQRLATGLRIATAADDAAGLAISERLRARIRSLDQARRNAADGVSLVKTGEGALGEVSNMLVRLRELAIQSSNGTVSTTDRETLDTEFHGLVDEIDRIGRSTEFNGVKLFDGSKLSVDVQVGAGTTTEDKLTVALPRVLAGIYRLDVATIDSVANASSAIARVDEAITGISSARGRLGAMNNRLDSTIRNLADHSENLSAAESRVRDVDIARESAELARDQILQQATISMLAQAHVQPRLALKLLA
tara:strand:+ start:474 stop:1298 length:825 start_codon:yes stop_codon:yes gene_type:complete